MTDKTKFIINTSVEYFDASPITDDGEFAAHTAAILEFLENEELTVIAATLNKADGKIKFHHRIPSDEVCLLFYKIPRVDGNSTRSNGHGSTANSVATTSNQPLGILTLEGGLAKSIYNSVSRAYSPHAPGRKHEYSAELTGLLQSLHVSLGTTLGLSHSGIGSVKEEIKYWQEKLAQKSSSRMDREMSQFFLSVLENIDKQLSSLDSSNYSASIEVFLDSAHNNLDELWRLPYQYPQNRMVDLLDMIGNRLLEVSAEQLLSEDIWILSSYHVNSLMSQCMDTVDSWIQLCDSLTRLFWPNYVKHAWEGDPYVPKRAQLFKERLGEIRNIKNLYKQIATLLNEEEIREMLYNSSPFSDFNIFDTSSVGQNKWNKALQNFEQLLQPIDERIASAIKAQLHNYLSNPRQIIFIFSKYETLIQRPTVLDLLTIEREQFVQSLHILLQDLRKAMTDTNMEPDAGHLSVICNECRWLKIVQHQIQEIEKVSHLISGRDGSEKINKAVQEIKEETESLLRTNFEIWCGQCSTEVTSGELRLRDDQPVVRFEKEGRQLMRVTFNPKLVTFCQDVREFENLGYKVPTELRNAATHASKFICYARRLQQIATFHNTIGDRMIPCQRPIMLKNAMELSKLVQSETVAWNDEESVQRYIDMLQVAVAKLSGDNTLLVGYHEQAKHTVMKLMNTDLFTQTQIWKDEMRHLRDLIAALERQGFNNLDAFKLHWDHQLYKVLEYQYVVGLVDMNNRLPDIHIDILFRQRQLCFRPTEEEIREKYFTQLRRFIERPCGFRGLSDKSGELFRSMVEINRHHFGPLFERAQELFSKLKRFKQIWLPWVALGCVDVEELCGIHLNTAEDWNRNFRACKNFSQKIAKIQSTEECIDCIVINIQPLRSDIELISRRYWEALSNSLRASILNDISIIQEFLQNSLQFLQNVPMDESSITESGMKYEKMITELPKISETLDLVKAKDTCLAGWCKERVSALAGIVSQWENLQPLIENHAVILQRQVDMIKDQAETQIQNLRNEAEKFLLRWESTISELESNDDATLDLFKERQSQWHEIQSKKNHLLQECMKFNMQFPPEILQPFVEIDGKLQSQAKQWDVYASFLNELDEILQEEWTIFRCRPYVLNELISKWEGSVHSSLDLPSTRIRHSVERLQNALPTLQQLQSDALNERHWARIFMLLKKSDSKPLHSILVGDILQDFGALQQASPEIGNIVKQASSEQIVKQALAELDQWSVTASFKLIERKDSSGNNVTLIRDYQEVLNKIGDNLSLLQSAKNSAAFEAFSDQAELWESRLNTLDTLLVNLSQSQRRWVYLEPVFGAGTLKQEEALFKRIDKDFRFIMREIQMDSRVISLVKINNITSIINSLETQLARCQNNLMSYITEKRNSFPRFYFLGDDDLLELLGQASKDTEIIQKHIKKLFPGCHSLEIKSNGNNERPLYTIQSVHSAEGDNLTLQQPIEMSGPIEVWLNNLVISIQTTLRNQIAECVAATATQQTADSFPETVLRKYPIQVLSTTRAVHFTRQTEKSISSMSLQKQQQQLHTEVSQYAVLKNQTKDNLLQLKLRALLLDLVHYATIVDRLIAENVMHVSDWHWLSQLKFYLPNGQEGVGKRRSGVGAGAGVGDASRGGIIVRMVYAEFEYSYEFLGNPNKLVNTSLTHKCYLILTQAMHMGLGGNPFGPAGTGKTECVKALGAMLGRLVLVFNCDENVDTESMGLILTGLARCGAWGCFDEFNRLKEATLSAISMLIQPIQSALKDKAEVVQILEKNIQLNHHCGIFVTLNPAGAEYGGRQKLPGNIQALFRPIVMQQPEPREISRVMLFVEGFQHASEIAERIVELFDLCAKMLSAQRHYDWGLRELKTILLACGDGLREHNVKSRKNSDNDDTILALEMRVVVRCLRLSTISKLALNDVTRFDMLLRNVFPEIEIGSKRNGGGLSNALSKALAASFAPLGLCANDMQIEKALQLHEQLMKRMGVVIVGSPGCGKSTLIALLRHALSAISSSSSSVQIRVHTISPKSMSRVQLLGRLDPETRQWQDGWLTSTAVTANAEPIHQHSWIVCDGSIDPDWIEALNSVLDDNKLLTLPSGWRIQFGNNVNFIFETDDVRNASPATISRMGIVNLNQEEFPQKEILDHLLKQMEFGDLLHSYIMEYFNPASEWLEKEYLSATPMFNRSHLTRSLLIQANEVRSREAFCVALCHALFGFVPTERHNELATLIFERAKIYLTNPNRAEFTYFNEASNVVDHYESDAAVGASIDQPLIQTAAVKLYLNILNKFLTAPAATTTPFLIVGPSGAAKTLLLQQAVQQHTGYDLVLINCSTQLTPNYIAHMLKQNCITASGLRGREYRPRQVRLVLFLKNLDLCYLDGWGASEVIEWLLQLIQRSGFYADNLEWVNVSGLQICGSISVQTNASSSANLFKIAPRFLALNQYLRVSYPTDADMLGIVQNRLETIISAKRFLSSRSGSGKNSSVNALYVAECLMECISKIEKAFHGAALQYAHYQFNPKLFMKMLDNLKDYPANVFNEALLCELLSTFKDRLATENDVEKLETVLRQSMRKFYGKDKVFFVPRSAKYNAELIALQHDEWLEEVQKQVTICSAEHFVIDEPITKELLEQAAKIVRVLGRDGTHLMIVGQPGGRQLDALYVATTMLEAKLQIIQGGASYGLMDFYTDLKQAMQNAALEDQRTCLLIEHCWVTQVPEILKPIEAILEGSEILDLFGDDLESIASSLKPTAQLEGYQESIPSYFMKRVRKNLHIIMALNPLSSSVNDHFNSFPSLHRNMEFLYVRAASSDTLAMLPKKFVEMLNDRSGNAAGGNKPPVVVSSYFSEALENLIPQQAPKRFYQLIRTYFYIFSNFSEDISKRLRKLQLGVDKLATAHSVVDTLKSNALQQEVALAEKRKLANDALQMISATMRSANDQKSNMLELKKQTQISSEKLKERQREIQQELSEVEPILAEASAAVGQIKSEALSEIRSLRAPPEAIRDILEGVLRLMGIRDTSWNSMKTFLAKRGVKEDIRLMDPARINPENCEAVERLLATKSDSFEMKNAKRASAAAAPLAAWVKASVRYSRVVQSIKPLEREQRDLERNLEAAEGEMQSLVTGLDDVDNRVKQLSAKLNAYTQEAAILEIKLEEARNTLSTAEILVEKLSAEFATWSTQLEEYRQSHKTLDTKSLLIALAVNYFSHMTLEKRSHALNRLHAELQLKEVFEVRKNLLTEQEQIIWESMGLTRDTQIIENAAMLRKMLELPFGSYPVSLILDPTQTALNWLEEYLRTKSKPFEIISQNSERLTYALELAVRFGKILVVQDCSNLRPPLLQMLISRSYMKFNKRQINVGPKLVDLHDQFQLVLFSKTTKVTDIGIESRVHLTCIPFTVTTVGLTDQLMSKAIVLKQPELEQKRIELLKKEGDLLKQRIELEDKLLEELSSAQGDVLKNEKLLQTLNEVKESSTFIDKSLKESAAIKETLLAEHTQLRELCAKAAQFYVNLTQCYEVSVMVFIKLFLGALEKVDSNGGSSSRSEEKVYDQLVRSTFQYLGRSTARSSQLTLGLYVCKSAYPERIPQAAWELFVTNFMCSADASIGSFGQLPRFIEKEAALKLQILLGQQPELNEQLCLEQSQSWQDFLQGKNDNLPGDVKSCFSRVLAMQVFRPELITKELRKTITKMLGITTASIVQPTVEQLVEESSADRPILIVTQSENDPATEIKSFAIRKRSKDLYTELSIGKGMERRAMEGVRQAAVNGTWICIKNVHLVPHWLSALERELDSMSKSNDFRLWLVCESTADFNESVMYKFVKVLYEFPSGIKNKVRRMLQNYGNAVAKRENIKEPKLLKIRVVMFIVTAVLQERRNFIPQGWSKYYEFGESDLKAALEIVRWLDAVTTSGRCDWQIMQRLCENVAFGGRINNVRDVQVLQRYLAEFCSAEVLSNRWTPLNINVAVPTSTQIEDYVQAIAKFPDTDEPEAFRLSRHSSTAREIEQSKDVMKELRAAYYSASGELADDTDMAAKVEKQVKPLLSLWRKLAGKCSVIQTANELETIDITSTPWTLFVVAELKLAARCFQEVHSTLSQVHNWLKETQGQLKSNINPTLVKNLMENQIPINWSKSWNTGPKVAVDFLKGLVSRAQAAEQRYRSEINLDFTESIDFSSVFNCENFMACLKLANSKKLGKSCKDLILETDNSPLRSTSSEVSLQVKVAPLKVDGAVFISGQLAISNKSSSSESQHRTPELYLTYKERSKEEKRSMQLESKRPNSSRGTVQLPLYANSSREKLVCELKVPSGESTETVLLSGAALIVNES